MFNSYCARQLFVSLMRAKVLYLLHRLNVTAGKHRPLSGCLGILSPPSPAPFTLSLSLTPAPLRRGIRYVTRFSPLLPEEVCICTTPCIAQSQGRLVGEPTRATIPRRRESRLPFILFPLLILLLFFFFPFSLFSFLRPNGSSFMIPALKTSHVVAHTSLSVFSSHGIVKKKEKERRI